MQRKTDKYLSKKPGCLKLILSRTLLVFTIITLSIKMNAQTKLTAPTAREEYIEVEKNVKLHVTDLGNGPAVVLIHGLPLNDAMFEYQYHELADKGYRVVGITLRGFGKSSKPFGQYNYDVFADDIEQVITKLELEHVTLGGFSMGGAIAIHYVAKFGNKHVSKLALFGAAAPIWTQRTDYPYGLRIEDLNGLITLSKSNRPLLLQNISKIFGASETSISPELGSWLFSINMEASPYATTQGLIALRDTDLRPELKKITIPTVIFHGTEDKVAEFALAEQMHQGIKGSKVVRFEKSGHGLFIEELEKFNSELIAFLKQ